MPDKEATARIKINKLLEAAGLRRRRILSGVPFRQGAAFPSCASRPNNPFQEFPCSTPTPNAALARPVIGLSKCAKPLGWLLLGLSR
ncbi:MAG TPA: hypothetical protein PLI90_09220 [Rhodocyclaceae bacterium]|nr:hypothetical protein [Rhodocyclaceae bacterium]